MNIKLQYINEQLGQCKVKNDYKKGQKWILYPFKFTIYSMPTFLNIQPAQMIFINYLSHHQLLLNILLIIPCLKHKNINKLNNTMEEKKYKRSTKTPPFLKLSNPDQSNNKQPKNNSKKNTNHPKTSAMQLRKKNSIEIAKSIVKKSNKTTSQLHQAKQQTLSKTSQIKQCKQGNQKQARLKQKQVINWLKSSMSIELKPKFEQSTLRKMSKSSKLSAHTNRTKSKSAMEVTSKKPMRDRQVGRKEAKQYVQGNEKLRKLNELNRNEVMMGNFLSGMNSIQSLGYKKVYDVDIDDLIVTNYEFLDERQEQEIVNKMIQDTEDLKEIKTSESNNELKVGGNQWITNIIIKKYLEPEASEKNNKKQQEPEDQASASENDETIFEQLIRVISDTDSEHQDNKSKQQNGHNQEGQPQRQVLLQKIKHMLSAVQALKTTSFDVQDEEIQMEEYTKTIQIVKLDTFLKERMIELVTQNMGRVFKRKDQKILRKWINHQVQKIRKARDLIHKGLKMTKNVLIKSIYPSTEHLPTARLSKNRDLFIGIKKSQSLKNISHIKTKLEKPRAKRISAKKEQDTLPTCFEDHIKINKEKIVDYSSREILSWEERNHIKEDQVQQNTTKMTFKLTPIAQNSQVSIENKQYIEEFVFLQLCIELIDEIQLMGQLVNPIYLLKKQFQTQPITTISISASSSQTDNRNLQRKRRGFGTTPKDTITFLIKFIRHLLVEQNVEEVKAHATKILNMPAGPKPIELLKFIRGYDPDEGEENQSTDQCAYNSFILDIKWYQKFTDNYIEEYDFGWYFQEPEKEQKRIDFMKKAMKIHNKAIFDAMNQTLDRFRPYGIIGQPYPWKPRPRVGPGLNNNLPKIFQSVCNMLSEHAKLLCGIIKDEALIYQLSDAEVEDIREDRLFKFLYTDIKQNEQKWIFYDDEETEALMQISQSIFESIIEELVKECYACK